MIFISKALSINIKVKYTFSFFNIIIMQVLSCFFTLQPHNLPQMPPIFNDIKRYKKTKKFIRRRKSFDAEKLFTERGY